MVTTTTTTWNNREEYVGNNIGRVGSADRSHEMPYDEMGHAACVSEIIIIYVYADRADSENGEVRKTSFPLSFASSSRRRDALSLRSVVENRSDRQFW